MITRNYAVLGPLMGGFNSQAFLGCEDLPNGVRQTAVMVFLPDEIVDKPDVFEQLLAETEVASRIDHRNVVSVLGLARIDDGFARVVEYADGESLRVIIKEAHARGLQIPVPVALKLMADACMGVHYAHELGSTESGTPLIHGAVRTGTLLVSYSGLTKVSGYGAAILGEGLRKLRGAVQTSDPYTAPEQILGGRNAATAQTDVYALGAVLFEILMGKEAPASDSAVFDTILKQQLSAPDVKHRVSDALAQLVTRAVTKRAVERYSSPFELREALYNSGENIGNENDVADFMETLFGEDYAPRMARAQLLTRFESIETHPSELLAPRTVNDAPISAYRSSAILLAITTPPQAAESDTPPIKKRKPHPASPKSTEGAAIMDDQDITGRGVRIPEPISALPTPPAASLPSPPSQPVQVAAMPAPQQTFPPQERVVVREVQQVSRTPAWAFLLLGMVTMAAIAALAFIFLQPKTPPAPAPQVEVPATTKPKKEEVVVADPPPKEEVVETAKAIVPEKGTLKISSSPSMTLYVDGKRVGTGRKTLSLTSGKHTIKGKVSGSSKTKTVTLSGGETKKVHLSIARGFLALKGPDNCTVYVDGKRKGVTPLQPIALTVGRHSLVVKKGETKIRKSVTIRSDLEAIFTYNFSN